MWEKWVKLVWMIEEFPISNLPVEGPLKIFSQSYVVNSHFPLGYKCSIRQHGGLLLGDIQE
jgi:hypothetical protein